MTDYKIDIMLNINEYQSISDIMYLFVNIRKGKGFDTNEDSNNVILKKIQALVSKHHFLFKRLNGYIFPTEMCYKLGI